MFCAAGPNHHGQFLSGQRQISNNGLYGRMRDSMRQASCEYHQAPPPGLSLIPPLTLIQGQPDYQGLSREGCAFKFATRLQRTAEDPVRSVTRTNSVSRSRDNEMRQAGPMSDLPKRHRNVLDKRAWSYVKDRGKTEASAAPAACRGKKAKVGFSRGLNPGPLAVVHLNPKQESYH